MRLLKITGGNVTQAAQLAKRNRTEFYKLLQRHQLEPAMFKEGKALTRGAARPSAAAVAAATRNLLIAFNGCAVVRRYAVVHSATVVAWRFSALRHAVPRRVGRAGSVATPSCGARERVGGSEWRCHRRGDRGTTIA